VLREQGRDLLGWVRSPCGYLLRHGRVTRLNASLLPSFGFKLRLLKPVAKDALAMLMLAMLLPLIN